LARDPAEPRISDRSALIVAPICPDMKRSMSSI